MKPTDPDCIFCKIVAGEIPAHVVYRDDNFIAFLDIAPVAPGHTLLVPTAHVAALHEAPVAHLAGLSIVLPAVAAAVVQAAGADGWNLLANTGECAGQLVQHVHFHLIPRRASETTRLVNWRPRKATEDALAEMRRRITSALDA